MGYRNPNGYGTVKKLSGKRRRPFAVYVTTGYGIERPAPKIDHLKDILTDDLYLQVKEQCDAYTQKMKPMAKQIQKCIGYYATRQDAMIALAEYNKNPYDIDKRNTTFGQIYDILYHDKIEKMAASAKASYVIAYKKCEPIKDIRMVELKKAHLQRIIDNYSEQSLPALNNILKLMHAVYKFALENDICEKDYSAFVVAESHAGTKKKVPFTKVEINKLWDNIDWVCIKEGNRKGVLTGVKLVDAVLINIYTGLRPSELLLLEKEDIDLNGRIINVRGTKTENANRLVPIHKKIMPLIKNRMTSDSEYLFPDNKGAAIKYSAYLSSFFRPMCEFLELEHTPHECRHTFISFANASNFNRTLLKKMVGHAAGDITEDVYTHAFREDLVKEIDKLEI